MPVLAAADAVLNGLDPSVGVAAAIRRERPGVPLLIKQRRPGVGPPGPRGCIPLPYASSVQGQIDALWRALPGRAG